MVTDKCNIQNHTGLWTRKMKTIETFNKLYTLQFNQTVFEDVKLLWYLILCCCIRLYQCWQMFLQMFTGQECSLVVSWSPLTEKKTTGNSGVTKWRSFVPKRTWITLVFSHCVWLDLTSLDKVTNSHQIWSLNFIFIKSIKKIYLCMWTDKLKIDSI